MKRIKKVSIVGNFFSLSVANVIANITVMVQGMILVRVLNQTDYGTFAQTNVVLNITNTIIGLGLAMSINYFIPKSNNIELIKKYTNNIFTLIIIMGLIGFLGINMLANPISDFFNNEKLNSLLYIVAFRPIFMGVLQAFINLFVAHKNSEFVAKRNIIISLLSLIAVGAVSSQTNNVIYIIIVILVLDILQCIYLYFYSKREWGAISFIEFDVHIIKDILSYSVPLAMASIVGTLMIQMDKFIIGSLYSTEEFAVYAVVSKQLPLVVVASAIITVIRPYITKEYNLGNINKVIRIWSSSIELAAIVTWTIGFTMILVSPELLSFLYTKNYLSGLLVFNIYILISMIGITYFGIILSSSGNSRYIFIYAIAALITNGILNYIFYWIFGYSGPAWASFCSHIIINTLQLIHCSKLLKCKIRAFFNFKVLFRHLILMIIIFITVYYIKEQLSKSIQINYILELFLYSAMYLLLITVVFLKKVKQLSIKLKNIDN